MKKIFAMVMSVVAMAVSMASCINEEADFIEQKAPVAPQPAAQQEPEYDPYIIEFVNYNTMDQLVDLTYVIETESETFEFNPFTAAEVQMSDRAIAKMQQSGIYCNLKLDQVKATRFQLPSYVKGQVKVSMKMQTVDGYEKVDDQDFLFFFMGGANFKSKLSHGVDVEQVNDYIGLCVNSLELGYKI